MGRTKMEVDALTSKIVDILHERHTIEIEKNKDKAKKIIKDRIIPLLKQRSDLKKKINSELKKLGLSTDYDHSEDNLVRLLSLKMSGTKPVHYHEVEREVILSGDQGADILVKKITEMFL